MLNHEKKLNQQEKSVKTQKKKGKKEVGNN